jgi:hypothetical protein
MVLVIWVRVGGIYYFERVLMFGLRTAPFIFNIFSEAFHWILSSYLRGHILNHYLDDFLFAFAALNTSDELVEWKSNYILLTNILGILRSDGKDDEGTLIEMLGRLINSIRGLRTQAEAGSHSSLNFTISRLQTDDLTRGSGASGLVVILLFCTIRLRLLPEVMVIRS